MESKKENKKEINKESALPMWVLLTIIGIGAIFLLKFLIFGK